MWDRNVGSVVCLQWILDVLLACFLHVTCARHESLLTDAVTTSQLMPQGI